MNQESLFVSLYLDADVNLKLAELLRAEGFEVVSAREVGNDELSDEAQLTYATARGQTIVTHNTKHFVPLFDEWWFAEKKHYGIVVSAQLPIGELLRRTLRFLNTVTADEMANNIVYLAMFADRE